MKNNSFKRFFWISLVVFAVGLAFLLILPIYNGKLLLYSFGPLIIIGVAGMFLSGTAHFIAPIFKEIKEVAPKLSRKEKILFDVAFALIFLAVVYVMSGQGLLWVAAFSILLAYLYKKYLNFYTRNR